MCRHDATTTTLCGVDLQYYVEKINSTTKKERKFRLALCTKTQADIIHACVISNQTLLDKADDQKFLDRLWRFCGLENVSDVLDEHVTRVLRTRFSEAAKYVLRQANKAGAIIRDKDGDMGDCWDMRITRGWTESPKPIVAWLGRPRQATHTRLRERGSARRSAIEDIKTLTEDMARKLHI